MALDKSVSRHRRIRSELAEVIGHLQQLHSAVAVAVSALRQQNADIDADVANLLQRSVGERLLAEVAKLETVMRTLLPPARRKR